MSTLTPVRGATGWWYNFPGGGVQGDFAVIGAELPIVVTQIPMIRALFRYSAPMIHSKSELAPVS